MSLRSTSPTREATKGGADDASVAKEILRIAGQDCRIASVTRYNARDSSLFVRLRAPPHLVDQVCVKEVLTECIARIRTNAPLLNATTSTNVLDEALEVEVVVPSRSDARKAAADAVGRVGLPWTLTIVSRSCVVAALASLLLQMAWTATDSSA